MSLYACGVREEARDRLDEGVAGWTWTLERSERRQEEEEQEQEDGDEERERRRKKMRLICQGVSVRVYSGSKKRDFSSL